MPFDVPTTIDAETARHVGEPKFLLPASEKAWPLSLRNRVQRTTSQGGVGVSVSPCSRRNCEPSDAFLLWVRKAGEDGRGE